jgi:hypothetical protein
MYMMMGEKEDFVPLNWDALVKNPAVFETIKEEMEKKFSAECLMTIITAAKEAGLKDKDIFMPVEMEEEEEEDSEEETEEYIDVFGSSVGNTIED